MMGMNARKQRKGAFGVPAVKQFYIQIKKDEFFSSFLHTILPARYSVLYHILLSDGKEMMLFASLIMMLCLRTVMYCATSAK